MLSPKNWSGHCTELEKFWAFQWSFGSITWILSWNGWRTLKHRNFSDEKPFTQVVIVKELNHRWQNIWCITPLTKFFFFFPMKDSFTAWETLAKKQVFFKNLLRVISIHFKFILIFSCYTLTVTIIPSRAYKKLNCLARILSDKEIHKPRTDWSFLSDSFRIFDSKLCYFMEK